MSRTKFYYRDADAPKPNKPNHIGTCIIIALGEKILLEHRADCDDVWGLIGGALEVNESCLDGIKREVLEETGILLKDEEIEFFKIYDDPTRIIAYPDGNVLRSIAVVYRAKLDFIPPLKCSEESKALRFFQKNEITALNIAKVHQPILQDYFM